MKLFKMTFLQDESFAHAVMACQMAYGCLAIKKRTLVWFVAFKEGDYEIIRDCLEEMGSKYKGTWRP